MAGVGSLAGLTGDGPWSSLFRAVRNIIDTWFLTVLGFSLMKIATRTCFPYFPVACAEMLVIISDINAFLVVPVISFFVA